MSRIVHIGLGNFHRAHQAWWTWAVATPDDPWVITAYTGRHPAAAELLAAQGCRYTLIEAGPEGASYQVVTAITEAVDGADTDHLAGRLADPDTRAVTLTVTEAGYHLRPDGRIDLDSPIIQADRLAVAAGGPVRTPPGRLLLGLAARWRAGATPIAVVPCDNLPGNGRTLRGALLDLAGDGAFADWIGAQVSFVDTCVDRITSRAADHHRAAAAAATGFVDRVPVVTEPFRDWVLRGSFPAGRPAWERAGARFVTDIEPWERRKLYLLNGAHSLLAYTGQLRGHATVAEAIADPYCAAAVRRWWDEVAPLLSVEDVPAYRESLLVRFANPAIEHRLSQIAEDGAHKLRIRVCEPAHRLAERGADRGAAAHIIAAWQRVTGGSLADLDPRLAADPTFVASVHSELRELRQPP